MIFLSAAVFQPLIFFNILSELCPQPSIMNTPKVPSRGQLFLHDIINCPLEGTLGVLLIENCKRSALFMYLSNLEFTTDVIFYERPFQKAL